MEVMGANQQLERRVLEEDGRESGVHREA